jgi:hypothetical protein
MHPTSFAAPTASRCSVCGGELSWERAPVIAFHGTLQCAGDDSTWKRRGRRRIVPARTSDGALKWSDAKTAIDADEPKPPAPISGSSGRVRSSATRLIRGGCELACERGSRRRPRISATSVRWQRLPAAGRRPRVGWSLAHASTTTRLPCSRSGAFRSVAHGERDVVARRGWVERCFRRQRGRASCRCSQGDTATCRMWGEQHWPAGEAVWRDCAMSPPAPSMELQQSYRCSNSSTLLNADT